MARKDKKEENTSQDTREKRPVRWELTEEDKIFLRSCNIAPE